MATGQRYQSAVLYPITNIQQLHLAILAIIAAAKIRGNQMTEAPEHFKNDIVDFLSQVSDGHRHREAPWPQQCQHWVAPTLLAPPATQVIRSPGPNFQRRRVDKM